MNQSALISLLQQRVKGLSSALNADDYTNAVQSAERDTGWSTTYSTDFQVKWMLERATRHLFFFLQTEAAHKFKYKQVNLQHRFEHYRKLVEQMDKEWNEAIKDNPHEFADAETYEIFGSAIAAGFAYQSQTGVDITYDEDQKVIIKPDDNS